MLMILLAAAMTIAMLAATAIGLHEETLRTKSRVRIRTTRPF